MSGLRFFRTQAAAARLALEANLSTSNKLKQTKPAQTEQGPVSLLGTGLIDPPLGHHFQREAICLKQTSNETTLLLERLSEISPLPAR
jgi:hypothetical protein